MDTLPPELLTLILSHVPKLSLSTTRLVNRTFSTLAFPLLFANVLNWLDYNTSHAAIMALAHDVWNRPAVMWSPWASCPDGPVQDGWLRLVWRLQMGGVVGIGVEVRGQGERKEEGRELDAGGEGGGKGDGEVLTPENYARLSGREDMTENRLRTSQNRYLMHRSYSNGTYRGDVVLEKVEVKLDELKIESKI